MNSCLRNLPKIINNYLFCVCFFAFMLIICLIPYYSNGMLILGGEGDYIIDFKTLLENFNFTWLNLSTGIMATSLNFNYFISFFYAFLQGLSIPPQVINFILIFSQYYLPFLAMFFVAKKLKAGPFLSFLIAYFYVVNPFSTYFLTSLNQWNSFVLFMLPAFFYIIFKFFDDNLKLFLYFGLFSFFFAFANANPPLMIICQLSIMFSIIFTHLHQDTKFSFPKCFKKFSIVMLSFILFNSWWILNWHEAIHFVVSKMYTSDFAVSWANRLVEGYPVLIYRIFSLLSLVNPSPSNNYLSQFYNSSLSYFVTLIPILILTYYLLKKSFLVSYMRLIILVILIVIFLAKGPAGIFGFIYNFALLHIPFFSVFKSPPEKWGVFLIFLFSLCLIFVFMIMKDDKNYKLLLSSFCFYLIFCSIPFVTSRFIPDYKMSEGSQSSRRYLEKNEYKAVRTFFNRDPIGYRILSLPGHLNYQVALLTHDGKYYTGMDPLLNNINKQFIAAYSTNFTINFDVIFNNISLRNFSRLTSLFNIGRIVINKDMQPWFGFKEEENLSEYEALFDKTMKKAANGSIDIYTPQDFLPRIFTSPAISFIYGQIDVLAPLTETKILEHEPALFFINQNDAATKNISRTIPNQKINYFVITDDISCENSIEQIFHKSKSDGKSLIYVFKDSPGAFYISTPGIYSLKVILENIDVLNMAFSNKEMFSSDLLRVDSKILSYKDFVGVNGEIASRKRVLTTTIKLNEGMHEFEKIQNPFFDAQWIIFESSNTPIDVNEKPQIIFKRINPAKYLVDVRDAKTPFWLVFNETFHTKWKLYRNSNSDKQVLQPYEIVAEYNDINVKEATHLSKFSPGDLKYIVTEPLQASHYQINAYANGWYIDPQKLGLGEDFSLTVFFWPQSLFYLGMGISALAFIGDLLALGIRRFRIKHDE